MSQSPAAVPAASGEPRVAENPSPVSSAPPAPPAVPRTEVAPAAPTPETTANSTPASPPAAATGPAQTAPPAPTVAVAPLPREFTVKVDPPDAAARLWIGSFSNVEIADGTAILKDLSDGEQELTVKAPGYEPITSRATVKDGRGSIALSLIPVYGAVTVAARPGTVVTAVNERGRETSVGTVPPGGILGAAKLLTVGRYAFRLYHPDCAEVTVPAVDLVTGRTARVAHLQSPLPGELRVLSMPSGAEVRVNGEAVGWTPATLKSQTCEQTLRVEVVRRGCRTVRQDVTLKAHETRTIDVGTLVAQSGGISLRISGSDFRLADAQVSVDGKPVQPGRGPEAGAGGADSVAPLVIGGLDVGSRAVEIVHPDCDGWRQTVSVRDQETTLVEVVLVPKPGTVACETTPAGARVVINGGDRRDVAFGNGRPPTETVTPVRGTLPPEPIACGLNSRATSRPPAPSR